VSVPVRLAAFAAVLGLLLLAGLGVGRAVGPVGASAPEPMAGGHAEEQEPVDDGHADEPEPAEGGHAEDADAGHGEGPSGVTGLAVSQDGYTLRAPTTAEVGTSDLSFVVEGPDRAPVTEYDLTHERELHLVVVRRDTTGFQHLHPERAADGTWSTPLTLDEPGAYRVYADFAPAGEPARTLATDLLVAGASTPQPWPAPTTSTTVDGFDVRLTGDLHAGEESDLLFEVTRDGAPVELEPYLGALGHLVVLREGDLGYLHVHADEGALEFATTAPSTGRYRLFLQFQVHGVVRTAELTQEAR